ncbi:MAG TPA: biosynthetic arginine decarboxylase [Deltaproteobacteria bacterium]|nr:biosynthetic arginine decarboxylase [Deltaproteobacteria bacterium]HRW80774.1 biosynthetic arginine decarboxylase [Desulfomonilia bacterium]NMD41481.1 biosynthetic arginine decarboxylase [Deltaproteobacteria bacterium]HNQ85190.1 biosynthetic arginine decarboxylase [Deltaproteobacteria bacterium]HNS90415.1 biosynthetic arginine decarboxylase [Deltaproteobacteria bacterium]
MKQKRTMTRWTVEDSADLYQIREWGAGYFSISEDGDVIVTPLKDRKDVSVNLPEIISGIIARGYDMPMLLRFEDILDSQIIQLHESFRSAIARFDYKGEYRGVYPIKVNQQKQVIEAITRIGKVYHHGLEAGSKSELIAALSFFDDKEACLICNGYKDREFIDLGLYACKMGFKCFFVLEMPGELDLILERSKTLGIKPLLGVRLKLSTQAGGHWTESGGDRSIFGLTISQIIESIEKLKGLGMLDRLQLLHYHLGSQIPNIRDIRASIQEACRVYAGLVLEGAAMGYFDLGGGLAVDYDGSHTNYMNSRNYTLDEYCADVIEAIMEILSEHRIARPPTIITESGRATVAYYSVLLFNIFETSSIDTDPVPEDLPDGTPDIICNLLEVHRSLTVRNLQECYNDALYYRDEVRQMFKIGDLTMRQRALGDRIFWNIIRSISEKVKELKFIPKDLVDIDTALCDTYYANFSVFQSLPDSWAIGHLFPVMPVHRLNEMPKRNAILADITCDSDGKIDRFIDKQGFRRALMLHAVNDSQDYYLGVFLVGAYQETLGDLHNLLGDTNVVSIRVHKDGSYSFVREIEGDTVADVLSYVEYEPKAMTKQFRAIAEQAIEDNLITPLERREIMRMYEEGLRGYPYFEK